jgi:hypothetical protein
MFLPDFFAVSDIYVLYEDTRVIFKVRTVLLQTKENPFHPSNFNVTTRYNIRLLFYVLLIAV